MAEIIRRGELPEERKYQGTCARCRSVVRFDHGEVNHSYDQHNGGSLFRAVCPVCGNDYMLVNAIGVGGLFR